VPCERFADAHVDLMLGAELGDTAARTTADPITQVRELDD
jgi:hypothetical protein